MESKLFTIGLVNQYHLLIPNEIAAPFADAKQNRVKVKASFKSNAIEFYAALKKDKVNDMYLMMFGKRYQKELGVFQNDYFEMQLFEDTSKYGVDMPEVLEAVFLSDYEAFEIFEKFTAGKKRSIIYGISFYKNSQTRIDRALILCDNLKRGITNPMELFKPN